MYTHQELEDMMEDGIHKELMHLSIDMYERVLD